MSASLRNWLLSLKVCFEKRLSLSCSERKSHSVTSMHLLLGLGKAAILDLKAVSVRLSAAAKHHRQKRQENVNVDGSLDQMPTADDDLVAGSPSSAVSLSTSK